MENNIEIKSSKTKKARKPKKVVDKKISPKLRLRLMVIKKRKTKKHKVLRLILVHQVDKLEVVAAVHHLYQCQYKNVLRIVV